MEQESKQEADSKVKIDGSGDANMQTTNQEAKKQEVTDQQQADDDDKANEMFAIGDDSDE